jgi:predicted alpha/beta superfamily hydrolase
MQIQRSEAPMTLPVGGAGAAAGFRMLPENRVSPSELDANPRYLTLPRFTSRFLPGERAITVYLPAAYLAEPTRRFPVFYLHDGQNLIDGRTSFVAFRTWQADRNADALANAGLIEPVILVGIANTGVRRMAEYTPTADARRGGGAGPRYGRLLVEELKPLIDRNFRTVPDAENTALGGSSLGGLITLAVALDYPNVFGKAAVMSPSIWWAQRAILKRVAAASPQPGPKPSPRIWLDIGTAEGLRHVRDTDLLHRRLLQRGWRDRIDLRYERIEGGQHDEAAWAARFDEVLRFLFPNHPAK